MSQKVLVRVSKKWLLIPRYYSRIFLFRILKISIGHMKNVRPSFGLVQHTLKFLVRIRLGISRNKIIYDLCVFTVYDNMVTNDQQKLQEQKLSPASITSCWWPSPTVRKQPLNQYDLSEQSNYSFFQLRVFLWKLLKVHWTLLTEDKVWLEIKLQKVRKILQKCSKMPISKLSKCILLILSKSSKTIRL